MRDAVLNEGVPLELALRAVTANPAALLKLERKGRIGEEMDGDLVLLDEKNWEISEVFAKGRLMISEGKVLVKGTFEQ